MSYGFSDTVISKVSFKLLGAWRSGFTASGLHLHKEKLPQYIARITYILSIVENYLTYKIFSFL